VLPGERVMLTRFSLVSRPGRPFIHYRLPGVAGHRALLAKMEPYILPGSGNM
jgi:hypothetical protein